MRRTLGAAAGTLAFAAVVAGSSITAAGASTASSTTEHFQFVTTSASSPRASAIAWGVFTAGGTIHINSWSILFPRGSFRAIHHRTGAVNQFNRRTCLLVSVEHGTYKLADGTGRLPAHQRRGYLHQPGVGRAQAQRQGALLCSRSCPGPSSRCIDARGPVRGVAGAGCPTVGEALAEPAGPAEARIEGRLGPASWPARPGPLRGSAPGTGGTGPAGTPQPPVRGPGKRREPPGVRRRVVAGRCAGGQRHPGGRGAAAPPASVVPFRTAASSSSVARPGWSR